ncbi:hypothetical protein DLM86_28585 [Paenibacillus flagellatus]|uniref:HTH luxR-type domain-containing protein n=2 Tax=Paenibacillus flagellatus TaxID=2211139 RepID=A0A2V5JVT9_9BACL|nr:hypothetical protein DLM86_28585 [Paenibacillus flagellatus]
MRRPMRAFDDAEPAADARAPDSTGRDARGGAASASLTPREREVLNLVLRGLSNQEIAEKLYISAHTVKNHITKIYEKLDVCDRTQALAKIYGTRFEAGPGFAGF